MLKIGSICRGVSNTLIAVFASLAPAADLRISGSNEWGQLGDGDVDWSTSFEHIAANVVDVEAGSDHILFKDNDQQLWGLGGSAAGQLGAEYFAEGQRFTTVPVLLSPNVETFHAGEYWSFFATKNGPLLAAGSARSNEIGYWNGLSNRYRFQGVFGLDGVSKVASYFLQGLFLKSDGTLYGTGYAFSVGKKDGTNADVPFLIAEDVIDIATGGYKSFYLNEKLELYEVTRYPYPGLVAENVQNFSHGGQALFTVIEGDLYVQGQSQTGALGLGENITQSVGHNLVAEGVIKVIASSQNAFFQKDDGSLWGMGSNEYGQLATGDFAPRFSPTLVHTQVTDFAANATTLFIVDSQNNLLFSGKKDYSTGFVRKFPTLVPTFLMNGVQEATVGNKSVFMIKDDDTLWVMGKNDRGELGTGSQLHILEPTKTLADIKTVSSNTNHTLFLKHNGQLLGSGSNSYGALGIQDLLVNAPVAMEDNVTKAVATTTASLYIKTDKTLWRTGNPTVSTTNPQSDETDTKKSLVASNVESVSGDLSTFYITTDKSLMATGSSILSQFNIHTSNPIEEGPILIDQDVRDLSARSNTVAYIKYDNSLWVFGNSYYLSENTNGSTFRSTPELIDTDVTQIKHGFGSLIYKKIDGSVWKIGYSSIIAPEILGDDARTPHQIWTGAPIEQFDYFGSNIVYLTDTIEAPSDAFMSPISETKVPIGDSVVLTGSANGDFLHYQWYQGQLGDRTLPIDTRGKANLTIYPYTNRTYWFEVTNDTGISTVPEAVTVKAQFPEYGKWATDNNLFYPYGQFESDEDGDSLSNLIEYAFDLNPFAFDSSPIFMDLNPKTGSLCLSLPQLSGENLAIEILYRSLENQEWQPLAEPLTANETGGSKLEINNSTVGEGLLLKVAIRPSVMDEN
ncbi:hypothetical protein QEH56_13020 [Pelagicoccus enzymogenes]|uniref:RCC1 domain-containing protein n=1 Tax=Pelagicoccus enzymogenes TaxID=2773457 RepID=UPI00281040DA|nr:hypothetical protein [Pelagicoccus enzymogenes]MDQ8199082.1 hypothetical protein [Pelagicoccus enzymogenes]